jgi:LuxR family transcriptional regulator
MSQPVSDRPHRESGLLLYSGSALQDFFGGVVLGARNLGFEYCGYLIGIPVSASEWRFVMTNNFPRAWQRRYLRRGYHALDPTVEYAKTGVEPMTWSRELFAAEALQDLSRDAGAIGFNHGWTQPLHDARGRFGMLTLARGDAAIDAAELQLKLPMMQWLAQVVHDRLFAEFMAWQRNESIGRLTERELACLRLAADGGTSGEISAATGVAERTVNFHMANAIDKLGATNKTHAVALALRLGVLA